MTSAQNHQQQSNGNNPLSLFGLLLTLSLLQSCVIFKSAGTTSSSDKPDFPTELEDPKHIDPNTGEVIVNQQLDITIDTIQFTEGSSNSQVIVSDATEIFDPSIKDPKDFNSGMKIACFLPFYASEFNQMDNRIPEKSVAALHFHNGILMALDELKSKNILVDVSFIDTEAKPETIQQKINSNSRLKNVDMLIGPFKSACIPPLADFAKTNKIPMLSPKSVSVDVVQENPYYLQSNPSIKSHCDALMANALERFKPEQIVLVGRSSEAIELKMLSYFADYFNDWKGSNDTSFIKEYIITNDTLGYEEVIAADLMHSELPSAIIIPSFNDENFVYQILNKIRIEKAEREITVYGLPQWNSRFTSIDPSMFKSLNVHITSSNFIDLFNPEIRKWRQAYYDKFKLIPEDEAFTGYTTTLYFAQLFSIHGPNFHFMLDNQPDVNFITEYRFEKINVPLLQYQDDFSYMPVERFENKFVHILQYEDQFFRPVPSEKELNFDNQEILGPDRN